MDTFPKIGLMPCHGQQKRNKLHTTLCLIPDSRCNHAVPAFGIIDGLAVWAVSLGGHE
tara:strand:+ start:1538 stop:1711 length:174 start_codon:yes stop_codon:yes gene_type:complete